MDSNETLRKAQQSEEADGMRPKIQTYSSKAARTAGMIICIVLMIIKIIVGQPWEDVCSIFCGIAATENYYLWFKLHDKKSTIVSAMLYTFSTVLLLVIYLEQIL